MNLQTHSLLTVACAALTLTPLTVDAQNRNTVLNYNIPLGPEVAEVTARGDYAYVARGSAGVEVVKISGTGAPARVGTIRPYHGLANIDIDDIEVRGNILYLGNDVPNGSPTPHTGLFMYDLGADPVNPPLSGTITWGAGIGYHLGASVHNFCTDESAGRTYVYIASAISNCIEVFDVTNPALPEFKDEFYPPLNQGIVPGEVHDVAVKNGVCVSTWSGGGFAIHDVSNIASSYVDLQAEEIVSAVTLLNYTKYANAMTWHAAFSEDGNHLITTDGRAYIGTRVWDLRTITAPNVPLVHTAQYTSGTGSLVHNVAVSGKYIYLSHFYDGLRVLELLPNGTLRDMAQYDTRPAQSGSGGTGAWGVCVAGGQVLVSDSSNGLYSIDFRDTIAVTFAEWRKGSKTLTIEATSTAAPAVALSAAGFGTLTWNANTGKYRLVVTGVQAWPSTVTLSSDIGGSQTAAVRKR